MATASNHEAEQQAIITILNAKDRESAGRLLATLTSDHFGTDEGNEVMSKISARLKSGRELPKRKVFAIDKTLSAEARSFLENIQYTPLQESNDVEALIEVLNFHRKIRRILQASRDMAEACKRATVETVGEIESKLDQLTLDMKGNDNARKIVTFGAGDDTQADEVLQRILTGDDSQRIKTQFDYFDSRAGGAKKGHAFLVAGPAGGGKSALANQMLINMYMKGLHKTLMVSFEMDEEECISRMCANVAGIDFSAVEQKKLDPVQATKLMDEMEKFKQIGKKNDTWFKVWSPDESLTASNIIAAARPIAPDVLVVDYIGLLGQDKTQEEQWKSLGSAMRQFKMAAKKMKCLIIVLAQFDQDAMVVKYARALREHANIMWCWTYTAEEEASGIVTIRQTAPFGKNRNCPPFDFRLKYELRLMRIHDYGPADKLEEPLQPKKAPRKGVEEVKKPTGRTVPGLWEED